MQTNKYINYEREVPSNGFHILAQQTETDILVYQAFNHQIANFAVKNQCFGGNHYSYSRMSWIKPNFLWMMYRCGWGTKVNQERILGIWLKKTDFDIILSQAVYSSFQSDIYTTHDNWKSELSQKEVRLQWDPDHDIYGQKLERRAIQIGMKGKILKEFGKNMILSIIDMTDFVHSQKALVNQKKLEQVDVAKEWIYLPKDEKLKKRLRIDS